MKEWFRTYRVFFPDLYTLVEVFVIPILIIFMYMMIASQHASGTAIGIVAIIVAFTDLYGDYFVFQGIVSKKFEYGILKNSLRGRTTLCRGIICDEVRRILVLGIVCTCVAVITVVNGETDDYGIVAGYTLTTVLATYLVEMLWLNIIRYFDSLMVFGMVTAIGVGIIGVVNVVIMFVYLSDLFSGFMVFVPFVIAGIVFALLASYLMVAHVLHRYDGSFWRS